MVTENYRTQNQEKYIQKRFTNNTYILLMETIRNDAKKKEKTQNVRRPITYYN